MAVLIDCGASNGSALGELESQFGPFTHVWAIEPNPDNARLISRDDPRIEIVEAAVSTSYGNSKLYLSDQFDGSTLYPEKISGNIRRDRFIEISTIDFADWLHRTVESADRVVCKMDIEGAEFDVLEHLLRTKQIQCIDLLLVEWHVSRFPDRWPRRWRRLLIKTRLLLSRTKLMDWR